MSIHDGHRQRLKERFLLEGLDNFTDIQVLELILFYAVPRRDTNPIAHALLDTFGSLSQVMEASVEDLEKVKGMGLNAAVLLHLMTEVWRYYLVDRATREEILPSINKIGEYLVPFFCGRQHETVFLLCLDAKCKVLSCKEVGEGGVNSANVPIGRIVKMALAANATTVVLAHNHPSGVALPSGDDIQTTRRVAAALATVDIGLYDHIVVAEDDFVSMVQSGYRFDDCEVLI